MCLVLYAYLCDNYPYFYVAVPGSSAQWNVFSTQFYILKSKLERTSTTPFLKSFIIIFQIFLTEGGTYPQFPTQPKNLYTVQTNTAIYYGNSELPREVKSKGPGALNGIRNNQGYFNQFEELES